MKRINLLILLFGFVSLPAAAAPVPVTLDQVAKEVGSRNYLVLENALRVYQAKEAVQVARRNLLPKLNLWKIFEVALDPISVVGVIEDIAPFLVPSNWFRVNEQRELYQAQNEAYRALWANEIMTAKSLYVHALLDESLLDHIEETQVELGDLLEIVRAREIMGGMPEKLSKEIEVQLLALEEDRRALRAVIREDKAFVAYMIGLPGNTEVELRTPDMPDFGLLEPLNYDDFEFRALDSSPEINQFEYLIRAADHVKKERYFSFLGTSSLSRGAAGGVFDGLPMQDGLGFGLGPSIRIAKAQKEILKLQRDGVRETIRRTLKLLVDGYNADLESHSNLKRRVELTEAIQEQLYDRIRLGDNVSLEELVIATRNHIEADTAYFAVQYRFLTTEDKLARLIFYGDYDSEGGRR